MRQQRLRTADALLEPAVAPLRKVTVTCEMKARDRIEDVLDFLPGRVGTVERNEWFRHAADGSDVRRSLSAFGQRRSPFVRNCCRYRASAVPRLPARRT